MLGDIILIVCYWKHTVNFLNINLIIFSSTVRKSIIPTISYLQFQLISNQTSAKKIRAYFLSKGIFPSLFLFLAARASEKSKGPFQIGSPVSEVRIQECMAISVSKVNMSLETVRKRTDFWFSYSTGSIHANLAVSTFTVN